MLHIAELSPRKLFTFASMIFVTGGTGLLGAQLLLDLIRQGENVRALKRLGSDLNFVRRVFAFEGATEKFNRIAWVDGDLLDVVQLEELISGCDKVYHAAAMVSFSKKDHDAMLETNI